MVGYHILEKMSNGYYLIGFCGVALTKYIKPPRRSPMLIQFLSKWAELQSTLMKKSTFLETY
jgi:hypothetical protein